MSFKTPTVAETNATIISQLESKFGQTIPIWQKAFLRVISKVLAAVTVLVYKYGSSIFLQQFVQYASSSVITVNGTKLIPLVEWGRLVGLGDPTEATRAEYDANVTVKTQGGTLIKNTQYISDENGVTYLTTADVAINASTISIHVKASSDPDKNGGRGTIGNLANPVGSTLSLVTPVSNLETDATITAQTVTAADAEDWEVYRQRVIDRFRKQPQGGALLDHEAWGEEVEGIINVYPYTGDPGIVELYSEANTDTDPDGIPTSAQLIAVKESVELDDNGLASRRPIGSYIYSYAITRTPFDITVSGLDVATESEAELKAKIIESLTLYFLAKAPFIAGTTLGVRNDRISRSEVSGVVQDVCTAYSAIYDNLTVKENGGIDFSVYSLGKGEKAKYNSIAYV